MGSGGGGGGSILPDIKPKDVALGVATGGLYTQYQAVKTVQNKINEPQVKARKQQEALMRQQQEEAAKLRADMEQRAADENAAEAQLKANEGQSAARRRQKQLAAGAAGRSDTILTSPLGVLSGAATGNKKTLLGQ